MAKRIAKKRPTPSRALNAHGKWEATLKDLRALKARVTRLDARVTELEATLAVGAAAPEAGYSHKAWSLDPLDAPSLVAGDPDPALADPAPADPAPADPDGLKEWREP